jgi:hypothetical protein
MKLKQYDSAKWVVASQEKQKDIATKLKLTTKYYDILKNDVREKLDMKQVFSISN